MFFCMAIFMVILVMITVTRFKRVEVLVTQDVEETTFRIFRKINFLNWYFIVFIFAIVIF